MSLELYAGFVGVVTALMLIPGPNVAAITAASLTRGPRAGLLTVAGALAAMPLQLVLAGLGLAAVLHAAGAWAELLRWAGGAYLVALGVLAWRGRREPAPAARRALATAGRGFVVALLNPKTLAFYVALFPQFVSGARPGPQIAVLGATYFVIAAVIDSGWALLAGRLRGLVAGRARWRERLSGGVLVTAGAGLALARGGR